MNRRSPPPAGSEPALSGGQARYLLVAQSLLDDIRSGRYRVGALLPGEVDLCQQYAVSRYTVREALRRLQEMGVITRSHGVGTRVLARSASARYVQSFASLIDLAQYAQKTRLEVRSKREVIAQGELCELLRCDPGQRWLEVDALRYAADTPTPIAATRIYIAAAFAGVQDRIGSVQQPVYRLIEKKYRETVVEVEQEIGAIALERDDAKGLAAKVGTPGLRIVRRYLGSGGQLLEVAISIHAAVPQYRYTTRLRLDRQAKD